MTAAQVLKWAILFFASLTAEERHGRCDLDFVEREGAQAQYWWACGGCSYINAEGELRRYLAAVLLKCEGEECQWIKGELPKGVDLGICERRS